MKSNIFFLLKLRKKNNDCLYFDFYFKKLLKYSFLSFRYLSFSGRKTVFKQKSETDKVNFSCRSGSITEQTVTTDDSSHYQDLRVSKDENTYQTLHKQ